MCFNGLKFKFQIKFDIMHYFVVLLAIILNQRTSGTISSSTVMLILLKTKSSSRLFVSFNESKGSSWDI